MVALKHQNLIPFFRFSSLFFAFQFFSTPNSTIFFGPKNRSISRFSNRSARPLVFRWAWWCWTPWSTPAVAAVMCSEPPSSWTTWRGSWAVGFLRLGTVGDLRWSFLGFFKVIYLVIVLRVFYFLNQFFFLCVSCWFGVGGDINQVCCYWTNGINMDKPSLRDGFSCLNPSLSSNPIFVAPSEKARQAGFEIVPDLITYSTLIKGEKMLRGLRRYGILNIHHIFHHYFFLNKNHSTKIRQPKPQKWSIRPFYGQTTRPLHQGRLGQGLRALRSHAPTRKGRLMWIWGVHFCWLQFAENQQRCKDVDVIFCANVPHVLFWGWYKI